MVQKEYPWKQKKRMSTSGRVVIVLGCALFIAALALFSPVMTGNAIGGMSRTTSTFIGAALFFLGIMAVYISLVRMTVMDMSGSS